MCHLVVGFDLDHFVCLRLFGGLWLTTLFDNQSTMVVDNQSRCEIALLGVYAN